MLTLEKSRDGSTILIRFRDKKETFNGLFWLALSIALVFHLSAFFLFHIHPFKMDPLFTFSPVQVQVPSVPSSPSTFLVNSLEEDLESRFVASLFEPSLQALDSSENLFSSLPLPNPSFQQEIFKSDADDFLLPDITLPTPLYFSPFRIQASGNLVMEIPAKLLDVLHKQIKKQGKLQHYYIQYDVQIDENGQVFWYDQLLSSEVKWIDQWIEKILLQLTFKSSLDLEYVKGKISFSLTLDETIPLEDIMHLYD